MLAQFKRPEKMDKKQASSEIKRLKNELAVLQQRAKVAKLPVVVLIDGWSASGKGRMISSICSELEMRGYRVHGSSAADMGETLRPQFWRYWRDIPAMGEITIFERGWYRPALEQQDETTQREQLDINAIRTFERQLCDDGYLVVKFFLHIDEQTQRERLQVLSDDPSTAWRATYADFLQNKQYNRLCRRRGKLMEATDDAWGPWHIIPNEYRKTGTCLLLRTLCQRLRDALEKGAPVPAPRTESTEALLSMPKLADVDLDKALDDEAYDEALDRERKKLKHLHGLLYRERVPIVICFEGWDAAGKSGVIRRLTWAMDPRGFLVSSVAAPSPDELARHYLWRFWRNLPEEGNVTIYDRSWYGRVMVERAEGLTDLARCEMAYDEINEFEAELVRWGAIVLKFWLHIDQDTQLERFTLRQQTPEKRHKITAEDWRNRDKWPQYERLVDEMLARTSTPKAPWVVVEANDKKYARIKVLKTVRKAIEQRLKEKG